MKAITIKQPWASLIVHGIKNIENRTWPCPKKYLGQRVLIHSSGKPLNYDNFYDSILTNEQLLALPENKEWKDFSFCTGSIIGSIEIVDCVQNHSSIWAEKKFITGYWLILCYSKSLFRQKGDYHFGNMTIYQRMQGMLLMM